MKPNVYLVCLSPFMLSGDMVRVDDLVEVTNSEAKNLLDRDKARLATSDDGVPEGSEDDSDTEESDPDEE